MKFSTMSALAIIALAAMAGAANAQDEFRNRRKRRCHLQTRIAGCLSASNSAAQPTSCTFQST